MPKLTQRLVDSLQPAEKPFEQVDSGPGSCPGFRVRMQPSGLKAYYLRQRLDGKPHTTKIGRVDELPLVRARELAESIRAQGVEYQHGRAESPKARRTKPKEDPTLGEWIDTYAHAVLRHRKSGEATLTRLQKCFPGFMAMRLDDPDMLKRVMLWRDERLHSGTSPNTVNRDMTALSACLAQAVERGVIEDHPLRRLKPLKEIDEIRVRYLTPDEEHRLLDALDAREGRMRQRRDSSNEWRRERGYAEMHDLHAAPFADYLKPLVLLLLNSGLRRGEALALRWQDIDFPARTLTVTAQGTKTAKPRRIPLNTVLLDTLDKWRAMHADAKPGDPLFTNHQTGERLTHFRRAWAGLLKAADIESFRVHDTRHHFASRLVQAGVPLNTVRELLGHASLTMTMRYAHLAPENGLSAVELLTQQRGAIVPFPGAKRSE